MSVAVSEMLDVSPAPPGPSTPKKSWRPTNKWLAALVTALGALVVNWIQAGRFTTEIQIALVGLITQCIVSYLTPNDNTPGGVPTKMP